MAVFQGTGCIRDILVPNPTGGGAVQIGCPADLSCITAGMTAFFCWFPSIGAWERVQTALPWGEGIGSLISYGFPVCQRWNPQNVPFIEVGRHPAFLILAKP